MAATALLAPFQAIPAFAQVVVDGGQTVTVPSVGYDTPWNVGGALSVGHTVAGTLIIEDGGTVSNATGYIGFNVGSTGTVTVRGTGSQWTNGAVYVGHGGAGTLTIENGGAVSNGTAIIGDYSTSTGIVTVRGVGSQWSNDILYIGLGGTGELTIEDGGTVTSSYGLFGVNPGSTGILTVSGAGSEWINSGALDIGLGGTGTLTIENGGRMSNTTGKIGFSSGSTSAMTVSGAGSEWINSGDLIVGNEGTGNLLVSDGGLVRAARVIVAGTSGSSGTVRLKNAGVLETGQVSAGGGDAGFVFDGGILRLTGNQSSLFTGFAPGEVILAAGGGMIDTQNYDVATAFGLSGAGALAKAGTGMLTLTGTNTHGGGTLVLDGTLTLTGANTYGGGTIVWDGALRVDGGSIAHAAEDMMLGYDAGNNAALVIENGGKVSNKNAYIGLWANSMGIVNVTGGHSEWVSDRVYVGINGTGALTIENGGAVSNAIGYIGSQAGSSGTATVTGAGSTWTNNGDLFVADFGIGELIVANGGKVSNTIGYIGSQSGSSGTAIVSGNGSTWTNSGVLFVGDYGTGALTIADGGAVSNTYGIVGYVSNGTVSVTGAGSTWTNSSELSVGHLGTGVLTVAAGGKVVNTRGAIGYGAGSSGTVTVTGPSSEWTNTGDLMVGHLGTGVLTVAAGGKVSSSTNAYIGFYSSSTGSVTVSGAGSEWVNSGELHVGYYGNGELTVSGGGTVSNALGYIGHDSGSTGTATVTGTGSKWTNTYDLAVGYAGSGELTIANGGLVSNGLGHIGQDFGSSGAVTVTGAGSSWANGDTLTIGMFGTGALTIADGGVVSAAQGPMSAATHGASGVIGQYTNSSGTVTVTGTGSTWTNDGFLFVGMLGTGELIIADGGTVSNTYASIGREGLSRGTATVTGAGSTWTNSSNLAVGGSGAGVGELTVANGGAVSNVNGIVGSSNNANGRVTVTGTGSSWTNSGTLFLASNGTGALTVADGGLVAADTTIVALNAGATGALRLESGGTLSTQQIWKGAGAGGVVFDGGILRLTGNRPDLFTGFAAGTIILDAGGGTIDTGGFDVATAYGLWGAGGLTKNGGGTLTLSGANSYEGATHVNAGTLRAGAANVFSAASTHAVASSATLDLNGFDQEIGALAGGGDVLLGAAMLTAGNNNASTTFGGVISGSGGLIKTGTGTLTLTGNNLYTGTTTIEGGLLNVQGTLASALEIAAGGRIGGSGTLGTLVVADGGILAPGNSIGTLTLTGDLTLSQASELHYDLGAPGTLGAPGASDRIIVGGNLVLDGQLHLIDDGGAGVGHYRLITYAGSLTDNILDVVTPGPVAGATYTIQAGDNVVDLVVAGGSGGGGSTPIPGDPQLQYWAGAGPSWTTTGTDWRNSGGTQNVAWAGNHGVFEGAGRTIAVEGEHGFAGLQFVADAYVLAGSGALRTDAGSSELRVLEGETATIATSIIGAGGIAKTQGGTLILAGTSTYAGATQVQAGTLDIAGRLASAVTVGAGGTLMGTGTIGGLIVETGGTLSPGNSIGTLTVAGDARFQPGSIFRVEVEAPGRADQVAVSGTATIDGGTVQIAKLSPETSYQGGQSYRLIAADSVVRNAAFDFTNPFLFANAELRYGADAVDLVLSADTAGPGFGSVARTFNQTQAAHGLSGLEQDGDALAVYNALLSLTDEDEARRAFDLSSGEVHAAGQHVIDQTFALFARTLRSQAMAGVVVRDDMALTDSSGLQAWLAPLGGRGMVAADGNAAALEHWAAGLAGGYHGTVALAGGTAHAGLGLGYIRSHGAVDARLSALATESFQAGAYGGWSDGVWTLAGALAYAGTGIATERHIAIGDLSRTARTDHWRHDIGFSGAVSHGFALAEGMTIAPLFTLDAGWSGSDGFAETGAGALDLTGAAEGAFRFDTGLGIAFEQILLTQAGKVTLSGRAVWEHAFADSVPSRSLALAGSATPFAVHGPDAGRDRFGLGAAILFEASETMTVRASYDAVVSATRNTQAASIGINAKF